MQGMIIVAFGTSFGAAEELLEVADSVGAVVKDGSGQSGVGTGSIEHFEKVFGLPGAAGRDHGNVRGVAHCER